MSAGLVFLSYITLSNKWLAEWRFEIYFKPVINSQSSKLVLSEAKLVWNMADGRNRRQGDFLTLFERNGFHFINGFSSSDGKYNCSVTGDIGPEDGISKKWGSIYFPGSAAVKNTIMLPAAIPAYLSYTIGMWLKPGIINIRASVLYAWKEVWL